MIDVHSHIIYGVDDGPTSIEESIKMICEAEELGVKAIFATPHFLDNPAHLEKVQRNYQELVDKTTDYEVSLMLGFETGMNEELPNAINRMESLTLGGTSFMLIEFPACTMPEYTDDVIYRLQLCDIIPIIAHPERNRNFVKNFDSLLDLFSRGCLIQVNAASIVGAYGRQEKDFAKKLIKNDMVHFVASDAHRAHDYINWYLRAYQKVIKWLGWEYADKLFYKNPAIILDDSKLVLRSGG